MSDDQTRSRRGPAADGDDKESVRKDLLEEYQRAKEVALEAVEARKEAQVEWMGAVFKAVWFRADAEDAVWAARCGMAPARLEADAVKAEAEEIAAKAWHSAAEDKEVATMAEVARLKALLIKKAKEERKE